MGTRFGRWIAGDFFPKLFLILYIGCFVLASAATGEALWLRSAGEVHIPAYVFYGVSAVLILTYQSVTKWLQSRIYEIVISFLACFMIYNLPFLLIWEAVALISGVPVQLRVSGVFVCEAAAALIVAFGYLYTRVIRTKGYRIRLREGTGNYHVALVSDLHIGIFVGEKHIERIGRKLSALHPDMILISGDLFDSGGVLLDEPDTLGRISKILARLTPRDGIYAVLGNHDPNVTDERLLDFLSQAGIRLLHNETLQLEAFNLVGRTDDANNIRKPMNRLMAQTDPHKPVIVLDHDPQGIREAAAYEADLVLCGHTHRGQFFPVNLLTKWANGRHYFYGYERFGYTQAVITSGAGFFRLPLRIGTSNEVADLQLQL